MIYVYSLVCGNARDVENSIEFPTSLWKNRKSFRFFHIPTNFFLFEKKELKENVDNRRTVGLIASIESNDDILTSNG